MRDAEELSLHLALAVTDHTTELLLESFYDLSRIGALGSEHRRNRCCRGTGREEFQPECLDCGARHFGNDFGVVNERVPTGSDIAACTGCDVIERRSERGDQRDCGRISRFARGGGLALLAEIEVVTWILARLHALPSALAHCAIGQPRRNHDGFLRSPDDYVDAPAIDIEM